MRKVLSKLFYKIHLESISKKISVPAYIESVNDEVFEHFKKELGG